MVIEEEHVFGHSEAMRRIASVAARVAESDTPVLIEGERGTGREVMARLLHRLSPRAPQPWVRLSCVSLPADLLEAELFGDERRSGGAPGRLEQAGGGTLFLKDVADLPAALQARLLHLLREGEFHHVNGRRLIRTDARIMASAGENLAALVRQGRFDPALYDRLAVAVITVPPLRERVDEIRALAEHLREALCRRLGRERPPLSPRTLELLAAYSWPGNVRELEDLLKRYVVLGEEAALCDEVLGRMHVPRAGRLPAPARVETRQAPPPGSLRAIARQAARDAEREAIRCVLEHVQWNRAEAARRLGVSYKTMLKKLEQANVGPKARRRRIS
ncbi:MAG: sigma-54-dependent Fis family transcriptional regulator [Candidatus Rokubacteria bacterium]|nr:sigma-54-dependent Fis family transcriptional regulator [Candidatus Rokubacteria bacterium]